MKPHRKKILKELKEFLISDLNPEEYMPLSDDFDKGFWHNWKAYKDTEKPGWLVVLLGFILFSIVYFTINYKVQSFRRRRPEYFI